MKEESTISVSKMHTKSRQTNVTGRSLGPVMNLEDHVPSDWWKQLFNASYLKTDGDVVDDPKITGKEVDVIWRSLKLTGEERILDLCCGHGRHTLELARRGCQNVEGLDRSHYLIHRARTVAKKENLTVKFREGDARKLPYTADTFDVILILGNSFGYFETINDDLAALKEAHRVLKPWGRLLIDVTNGDHIRNNYEARSWEWLDNKHFVCRERSLSFDKQKLICREVITHTEKGVLQDQFYAERLYNPDSMRQILTTAGFTNVILHAEYATDSSRNQDLGMMARRFMVEACVRKDWTVRKIRNKKDAKNIVVLLGDPQKNDPLKPNGIFDDDDLYTIDQLKGALRQTEEQGSYRFHYLNNHDGFILDLLKLKEKGEIDFVLNFCDEGLDNEAQKELHVPALLDILKIPYTGAGPQCLAHCYDKSLIRGVASEMQIPVAKALFIKPEDTVYGLPIDFPVLVKPNFGDSSFGITQRNVAHNLEELINAITDVREKFGYGKPILVEEFLTGSDLTVGIIGNAPESYTLLPIVEEDYSALPEGYPKICGYEAKWLPDSPYWNLRSIPAKLSEDAEKIITDCSVKLFERLECRDCCRFDWRLDAKGRPRLLEVNPNPGWVWDGHLAKMAQTAGYNYAQMLKMILQAAEERLHLTD